MKKIMFPGMIFILLFIFLYSCSDGAEKILSAYKGDTELSEGDEVPFLLYQNYPNPFNPSTSITFEVFTPIHLKLAVYSEEWEEVKVLLNEPINVGSYRFSFHMESEDIPSGDYYYTLEGGDYIQIRKMKILK